MNRRHRLAILISGRGSNMVALVDGVQSEEIPNATVVVVISDQPKAPGLASAEERGVPVLEGDTVETLAARILEQEHKLYREAVESVLKKLIPSVGANSQTSPSALS